MTRSRDAEDANLYVVSVNKSDSHRLARQTKGSSFFHRPSRVLAATELPPALLLWCKIVYSSGYLGSFHGGHCPTRRNCPPSKLSRHDNVPTRWSDQVESEVKVYDNVFSREVCETLHKLAVEHAERVRDGSSLFYRHDKTSLSPLERALDSFLKAVDDPYPVVEYWSRQEYLNLEVHADVDEEEFAEDGVLRYPAVGHVLYLKLADGNKLSAPTTVFPKQLGIWNATFESTPLTIVPAVPGRVLRFQPGSAMHAVPKPATRWLLDRNAQLNLDVAEDQHDGDDGEEGEQWDERSVILFNTWSETGPRGVSLDTTGLLPVPEGIAIETDEEDVLEMKGHEQLGEWTSTYGEDMQDVLCTPMNDWMPVPIHHVGYKQERQPTRKQAQTTDLCVPLMGTQCRRGCEQKFLHLFVSNAELKKALTQSVRPTTLLLKTTR